MEANEITKAQEDAFFRQQAREDLVSFCVLTDKFFEVAEIHEIIALYMQRFMMGEIKKLILQLPPRSGKTRITSESIAWAFGHLENTDVIYTGHSVSLLETISRNIRERVNSGEYRSVYPKARMKPDNGSVTDWSMTNGNHLMIYGVGGGITGKGGHRLIIDDPYATRQDAESDTIRRRVEEWYDSTLLSRRHNENAGICLIMQRWREDDLVGYVTERESDWHIVKVPAINDQGESYWPSRFSIPYLEEMRKQIGDYFFSSQYQQDPINVANGDFTRDMFRYASQREIEEITPRLSIVSFLDPAISQKQEADFSAIVTIGMDPQSNNAYVLEVKRLKETPANVISEAFETARRFRNAGRSYRFGVEVVQYQKMLAQEIRNQMRIRDCFFTLEEVTPQGEKNARMRSVLQPRYSNGAVIHENGGENVMELEAELLKFPNGKHDDVMDALASAMALSKVTTARNSSFRTYARDVGNLI